MHLNIHEASLLVQRLHERIKIYRDIEVVLAPSLLTLQPLSLQIDHRKFHLAAQDGFYVDEGAYTGEVSFAMLRDIVDYSIIGHSERRIYFHEDNELIRDKVAAAVRNKISPILCIGETAREHHAGETKRVLHEQLTTALSDLTSGEIEQIVIAYEPVWAISTFGGELAKPHDVELIIAFIREQIAELYGKVSAEAVRVLYGGSVNDQVVSAYLEIPGCDGALVGNASLNDHVFAGIVTAAERLQYKRRKLKS